jgi:hypothetical protein
LVQALSYVHVLQLFISTFVSSFRHERISTIGRSTRGCKCKIYLTIFNLINYNEQIKTMGCMVDRIHLDKNTFRILFQKGTICDSLLFILPIVTVYIYM